MLAAPALALAADAPQRPSPADAAKSAILVEAAKACAAGPIDLLGGVSPETSAKYLSVAENDTLTYLKLHQACLAGIPETANSCDALESVRDGKRQCLEDVEFASVMAAVVGGKGDARAACEQFMSPQNRATKQKMGGRRNKERHARNCDFFISALRRGSSDVCGEAKAAGVLEGPAFTQCQQRWLFIDGQPDRCAADPDKYDVQTCREKAALISALRTRDFRACALSPWCRAVSSGRGAACAPYLETAQKLFCAQANESVGPILKAKAAADARIAAMKAKEKKTYSKGQPMRSTTPDVEKKMKQIEEKKSQ